MSFQNNKYTLRLADTADNEGIREIFESESFRGNLDVKFLRNPAPYESFSADGDAAKKNHRRRPNHHRRRRGSKPAGETE